MTWGCRSKKTKSTQDDIYSFPKKVTARWDCCNFGFLTAGLGQRLASRLGKSNVVQLVDDLWWWFNFVSPNPEVRNAVSTMVCFGNSSCCAVVALHAVSVPYCSITTFSAMKFERKFLAVIALQDWFVPLVFWFEAFLSLAAMEAQLMRLCKS